MKKIQKISNFQYIMYYKNCYRPNMKKVKSTFLDNMSGNINVKFEPCSSKTVGEDSINVSHGMVLR